VAALFGSQLARVSRATESEQLIANTRVLTSDATNLDKVLKLGTLGYFFRHFKSISDYAFN